MSKRIIVFFAVLFIGLQAFAQTTVSGVVSDEKGETLVGVNIQIKGTSNGTMTDLDGKWSLNNVNAKTVLVFSSIGYTTEEITVGTQRNIKVTLKEDNNFLDEVVVVGYGTARKKTFQERSPASTTGVTRTSSTCLTLMPSRRCQVRWPASATHLPVRRQVTTPAL